MKRLFVVVIFLILIFTIPLVLVYLFNDADNGKVVINKELKAEFLKDNDTKVIVLFFGYVGCIDVCTPILEKLNKIYMSEVLKDKQNDFQIVFVNLTPKVEPQQADLFAKAFNDSFKGLYLTQEELFSIDRKFSVYFSDGLFDKSELTHTDYIYLIQQDKPQRYILKNMYTNNPLHEKVLTEDILEAIRKE